MPDPHAGRPGPRRVFRLRDASAERARGEVREELEYHLELRAEELIGEGWPPEKAMDEARRRFGDLEYTMEYCARETARVRTEEGRMMWWDDFRQDLKYAARTLFRSPTYAFVVIVTLAAGIAANTTIFSLMNPYLFRPLPFTEADELVQIGGFDPVEGWDGGRFSAAQVADLEERSRAFDELGYYYYGTINLTGGDRAERRNVGRMSGNMFSILGAPPLMGRYLTADDAGPGGPDVVVMGETLWAERYASDPNILGRTIALDGRPHTVVGVMPEDFTFPFGGLYLWTPTRDDPVQSDRQDMWTMPIGRLNAGWDPEQARAELATIQAELAALYPDTDGQYESVSVKPLRAALNFAWSILRLAFYLLLGAVFFVLVIACVNVASLTLARASVRGREVAVRSAVGADRRRLVRQLVTESFLLAIIGGSLGVLLAYLATGTLNGMIPIDLYKVGDITVDGRVLLFTAAVTLTTPFVFGLAPAMSAARAPLVDALRSGGAGGATKKSLWSRQALVIVEVTLAIVLVTGTGLMIRSLRAVSAVELGFDADRAVVATVAPGADAYGDPEELTGYYTEAKQRLAAQPGVAAVGAVSRLPLNNETIPVRYQSSSVGTPVEDWPGAFTSLADGDYFEAMGIPLTAGRTFTAEDHEEGSAVIVSSAIADRLFPDGSAVGRVIQYGGLGGGGQGEAVSATIVGVVGEVRYSDLTSAERPHIYRPLEGSTTRRRFMVIRAAGVTGATASLIAPARESLRTLDPDVPATVRPLTEVVDEKVLFWTIISTFLGIFGLVALALAALGIYGLMAFTVAQRRQEMGLRMALGADAGEIQRSVVARGLKLTVTGLVVGVLIAVVSAGFVRSILYGVSAIDPVTLIGVTLVFGVVSVVAAGIPARRAARVDPLQVLRTD